MIFEIVLAAYACLVFLIGLVGPNDSIPDFMIDAFCVFIMFSAPILTLLGCIGIK